MTVQFVFLAIALVFVLFEFVREIHFLVRHKNCRTEVLATVISLREHRRGRHGSTFKATVSYDFFGVHYSKELHHSYRYHEMSEGETVTVLVDENQPSLMLESRERRTAIRNLFVLPWFVLLMVLIAIGAQG